MPNLLTTAEVGAILGLTKRAIKSYISKGLIKAIRIGHKTVRVEQSELDAFIARKKAEQE